MIEYKIKIREILERTVSIEAENEEEAIYKAEQLYRNCDIVLDSEDYKGVTFTKEI